MGTQNNEPAGGLTSVRRTGPTQQVRDQLLAAIERGDFPPGAALPSERKLCETFGVSRVSVRAAIAGLESAGLVRVEHGRGVFVRDSANDAYVGPFAKYLEIHRDEIVELLKVRGALDELAAVDGAEYATGEKIVKMRAAEEAFRSAVESGETDLRKLSQLDVAFHMSIAALSNGQLLAQLIGELNGVLEQSRRVTLSRRGQPQRSSEEHTAIADAIEDKDPLAARLAVRKHIAHIRSWVDEFKPAPV